MYTNVLRLFLTRKNTYNDLDAAHLIVVEQCNDSRDLI